MVRILIFLFISFMKIKYAILKELKEISLSITTFYKDEERYENEELNDEIGRKGLVKFIVEQQYNYQPITINYTYGKWKAFFQTTILDENKKSYKVGCGPWKKEDDIFYIFCELNEVFPKGKYFFQLDEKKFNYSGYEIKLNHYPNYEITKLDSGKIDLYSPPQTIKVNDNEDIYELKFDILIYNQETIYLKNFFLYDSLNCQRKRDELICPINKSILEKNNINNMSNDLVKMGIYFLNKKGEFIKFPLISNININYNIKKEDVYVKITKLLTNNIIINNGNEYIAYETNVTNIPSVNSEYFSVEIERKKENIPLYCYLKKEDKSPLLMLCNIDTFNENIYHIKDIESNIILNQHIKYNFIILPVNYKENITAIKNKVIYKYPIIYQIFPNFLNFTKEDLIIIDIYLGEPNGINGITFNENEEDLKCINLKKIKRCQVPKEHFKGKNDGYYYIKYNNNLDFNTKSTAYKANPIVIIISKETNNSDTKSENFFSSIKLIIIFIIILVIVICIFAYKKKITKEKKEVVNKELKEIF